MHIDVAKLRKLAQRRGLSLHQALRTAHVSRTAYYSLVRKDNLLPKSLQALADALAVPVTAFLSEPNVAEQKMRRLYRRVDAIVAKHPRANRDNLLHTLLLLEEPPIDRLRRSLQRAQAIHIHR